MPNYLWLDITLISLLVVSDLWVFRTRVVRERSTWIVLAIMLVMTVLFTNYTDGLPIIFFNTSHLTGLKLGFMPIEDLGYCIGLCIIVPMAWKKSRQQK